MSDREIIKMFPVATKYERTKIVPDESLNVPNNKSFGRELLTIIGGCLLFAIACVVILVIMGALKAFGVKSLE